VDLDRVLASGDPRMTDDQFIEWLKSPDCGYVIVVQTGKGRWVGLLRLMFHWTMHAGDMHNMVGHDQRYCYKTFDLASQALTEWAMVDFEGEPSRWHKDPYTGRLRPDGDPEKEYLAS
jgi:hypothetical protein